MTPPRSPDTCETRTRTRTKTRTNTSKAAKTWVKLCSNTGLVERLVRRELVLGGPGFRRGLDYGVTLRMSLFANSISRFSAIFGRLRAEQSFWFQPSQTYKSAILATSATTARPHIFCASRSNLLLPLHFARNIIPFKLCLRVVRERFVHNKACVPYKLSAGENTLFGWYVEFHALFLAILPCRYHLAQTFSYSY